jgi:hypothetical protein
MVSARVPQQSDATIKWHDEEGHAGFLFCFFFLTTYVLKDLPVNLRGRDVLQGMGAILCSSNSVVSHMMLQQDFDPQRGLGKTQ